MAVSEVAGRDTSRRRQRTYGSRWALAPAVGAGLVTLQSRIVAELGAPTVQLRALSHLGEAWADPLASMLALMAMLAEVLIGYLLLVLVLRSIAVLPGAVGRLAARLAFVATPRVVRRGVDLLVGGALLTQATLAVLPAAAPGRHPGSQPAMTAGLSMLTGRVPAAVLMDLSPATHRVTRIESVANGRAPVDTRPTPRRASAPLPPWLGGGPSKATEQGSGRAQGHLDRTEAGPGTTEPGPGRADVGPGRGEADPGSAEAGPGRTGRRDPASGAYTVQPHDTLWDIAAARLTGADRSAADIQRYWQQIYRANRRTIGPDPDLIHPGTRLDVSPYRRGRR
jgi:resuscitation-promoting factor RpfA